MKADGRGQELEWERQCRCCEGCDFCCDDDTNRHSTSLVDDDDDLEHVVRKEDVAKTIILLLDMMESMMRTCWTSINLNDGFMRSGRFI